MRMCIEFQQINCCWHLFSIILIHVLPVSLERLCRSTCGWWVARNFWAKARMARFIGHDRTNFCKAHCSGTTFRGNLSFGVLKPNTLININRYWHFGKHFSSKLCHKYRCPFLFIMQLVTFAGSFMFWKICSKNFIWRGIGLYCFFRESLNFNMINIADKLNELALG